MAKANAEIEMITDSKQILAAIHKYESARVAMVEQLKRRFKRPGAKKTYG